MLKQLEKVHGTFKQLQIMQSMFV